MTRIISLHYASTSLCPYRNNRVIALDMAKGFTVLFIPAIHSVMLYSSREVHYSLLGSVLRFIAEWPGAQVLMFCMGMSASLSKKSFVQQLKRAAIVFLLGYVLNVLKFLVLYRMNDLPDSFLHDLHFAHAGSTAMHLFLIGDILQFAGAALALMAVLKTNKYYAFFAVFFCFIVIIGSPVFWDWHHSSFIIDQLLHLAGGNVDDVFFPLFPWLVYPLCGLAIGAYLQGPSSITPILISGSFLLASGFAMQYLPYHFPNSLFWRTYSDQTMMHLGFVLCWMSGWLKVTGYELKVTRVGRLFCCTSNDVLTKAFNIVKRIVCFCGRKITVIYLVQWVIIFWMLPLVGYRCLDMGESIVVIGFVYVIVFGVVLPLFGVFTNNKRRE